MDEFDASRDFNELNPEEAKALFFSNQDLKEIWNMKSGAGKRIMLKLFGKCKPMEGQFYNSGSATNYYLGRASIGQELAYDFVMAGIHLSAAECFGLTAKELSNKLNQLSDAVGQEV